MAVSEQLRIVGASARAAAFSALRAGLDPLCADLFADRDLQNRCSVTRLTGHYPNGFRQFIESDLPGPWMYTGGLENWPQLVERWARRRPLWGNAGRSLSLARNPEHVSRLLLDRGMPAPTLCRPGAQLSAEKRWLWKPARGAGGVGIRFWSAKDRWAEKPSGYCQEFIEGQPAALLFVGCRGQARLLGMTRQLVGIPWLHAGPFAYCGSIGPIDPTSIARPSPGELGNLLASESFLEGLFGVDGILRDGSFWPVEINPRYTASVEVVEHATHLPALACHAHVFLRGQLPASPLPAVPHDHSIGKAILFARDELQFPADGPWMAELRSPAPGQQMPAFADIPAAGERIEAGRPILTFFARGRSPSACEDALRCIAEDLDRWLYRR
jgi:predicted ATP-grasp superfamily ATP-dependent carboligase